MFSIHSYIFLSTFFLMGNAEKLFGHQKTEAVHILDRALDLLVHEGVKTYEQHGYGVDAAYKFIPNIVYTFDSIVQEYNKDYKHCIVSISYSYGQENALVTIRCEGEKEVITKIINEKIFAPS